LELIEQDRINSTTVHQTTSYNVYDGHGSVRALTDTTGAVTDTYDYDAFGNLIHSTGTTPNVYLYSGEQFDPDLHLYYNRARYLNVTTGRFWTMDTQEGNGEDPLSLHKYSYVEGDPVDAIDPTGRIISNFVYGGIVHRELGIDFTQGSANRFSDSTINTILVAIVPGGSLRPDLADRSTGEVYEIKPSTTAALGYPQLAGYLIILNRFDPLRRIWVPGGTYLPKPVIQLGGGVIALLSAGL
jgi:RHS repeat-associated protein